MPPRAKRALKQFQQLREMAKKSPNPFKGMTQAQVIQKLRKTREELWEEKLRLPTQYRQKDPMMKPNIPKAKKHLKRIREIMTPKGVLTPHREQEIINKIRRDRESIWGEKLASHS